MTGYTYTCGSCGTEFPTLTKKRLHQRDDCPETELEMDISDLDGDGIADLTIEELGICDVCGESNNEFDDYEVDETDAGLAFTLIFECSHCTAHNHNEAILS